MKDSKISEKVGKCLEEKLGEASDNININSRGGYVHLSGVVDVLSEKKAAEDAALNVSGVTGIENNITISMDKDMSDKKIEEKINKKLRNSLYHNNLSSVTAKVEGGTAILHGSANNQALRKTAMSEASNVPGISNVVNEITLTTTADDIDIQNEVNRLFIMSYIDTQDVKPSINDGIVTLIGYVNNNAEAENLCSIVDEIPGVKKVINKLTNRHWSLD